MRSQLTLRLTVLVPVLLVSASIPAQLPLTNSARALTASSQIGASSLADAGREVASIAAMSMRSVVHIESIHEGRRGDVEETGSGVLVTSPRFQQPFVVTNRHVVADAPLGSIMIRLSDGRVITPRAKLEDPESDLAVLQITDPGIPAAQFADSDNLDIGHFVLAMGSPFGLSESITLGIISAKGRRSLELPGRRRVINQDFLQTDAAINPGNSGGPLIDMQGRVVGINTAIASQGGGNEGIGFSIPSNLVRFIVEQLLDSGRVRRGYLGVELDEQFDHETARRYGLSRRMGARVTRILDGTPAAHAGIRVDDVVLNFDGSDIEDETDLINRVSLTPINKTVRLIVLRAGQRVTLNITLTERRGTQSAIPAPQVPGNERYENVALQVLTLEDGLAVQAGFAKGQRGLLVTQVPKGEMSLKLYDVITEVGRQPVNSATQFDDLVAQHAGGPLLLRVTRIVGEQTTDHLVLWPVPSAE
ncbi:MAG: trypsin-like peptidase domain-containing protein [Planctomycetaceae bacterium]|nr:trypsin-like peptidase domain-containing protein [Planctomycetaceae bacterium]